MTFSIDFCHVKHSVENLRSKIDYLSSKNVCSVVPKVCFHLKEVNFILVHPEIYRSVLVTSVNLFPSKWTKHDTLQSASEIGNGYHLKTFVTSCKNLCSAITVYFFQFFSQVIKRFPVLFLFILYVYLDPYDMVPQITAEIITY